jgi:hypothetical protein
VFWIEELNGGDKSGSEGRRTDGLVHELDPSARIPDLVADFGSVAWSSSRHEDDGFTEHGDLAQLLLIVVDVQDVTKAGALQLELPSGGVAAEYVQAQDVSSETVVERE